MCRINKSMKITGSSTEWQSCMSSNTVNSVSHYSLEITILFLSDIKCILYASSTLLQS